MSKLSHYFSEKVEILAFNSQERPDFTLTNYRGPNFQHSPSAGLYFIGEKLGKKDWNYLKQSIDSIFNRLNQKLKSRIVILGRSNGHMLELNQK